MQPEAFIKITNNGEVDINAFRLMGATTKISGQIGYFGSGNKYAIATALRLGVPMRIFSGSKEIKLSKRKTSMRGQDFEVVCVNGTPTSITTNMGRDWEPWFVFRELYCNAIDEGGEKLEVSDTPVGEAGKTAIYIGMTPDMKEIFSNLDWYFSQRRDPIHRSGNEKVYKRLRDYMTVYRKGIRVFYEKRTSLYDYDFSDLKISEARTASEWDVNYAIINFWKGHASLDMIRALPEDFNTAEFKFDWELGWTSLSRNWLDALKGTVIIPYEQAGFFTEDLNEKHVRLPATLCLELHKTFGDKLTIRGMVSGNKDIVVVPRSQKDELYIKDALAFLKQSELFKDIEEYPIEIAAFERAKQLGAAKNGTIYLSKDLTLHGKREFTMTLLEEYIHLKREVSDHSRAMQDALLQYVVSSMEEKSGLYL